MTNSKVSKADPPLLQMVGICKSFPGVRALDDVSIRLERGGVLGIVGENGAGKSTLIKILGGAHQADRGTIEIDGRAVELKSPRDALQAGIGVIYQEFNLVPSLSVRENIFLGRGKQRGGWVDASAERAATRELFEKLGLDVDPDALVSQLSIAERQLVEIAKSLHIDVRVLVMDEPTATLTPAEVEKLYTIIAELKSRGIAIVYISHRLDEVLELADRVLIMRDGRNVAEMEGSQADRRTLIEWMVGRTIENEFPKQYHEIGDVCLSVNNLTWYPKVNRVRFELRTGEVLGITGLMGAGRTELGWLLSGARQPDQGEVRIRGSVVRFRGPLEALNTGVCMLTEDRKEQGLILGHSLQENFGLPNLGQFSNLGVLSFRQESTALKERVGQLSIKATSIGQSVGQLSGGNQQKLVLAKWLQRDCEIIIIDEPTRGIDVGAKYEIYCLINQLAAAGKAIVLISSELPEVLGMSDRILVMRQGSVAHVFDDPASTTQSQIMEFAAS